MIAEKSTIQRGPGHLHPEYRVVPEMPYPRIMVGGAGRPTWLVGNSALSYRDTVRFRRGADVFQHQ